VTTALVAMAAACFLSALLAWALADRKLDRLAFFWLVVAFSLIIAAFINDAADDIVHPVDSVFRGDAR